MSIFCRLRRRNHGEDEGGRSGELEVSLTESKYPEEVERLCGLPLSAKEGARSFLRARQVAVG